MHNKTKKEWKCSSTSQQHRDLLPLHQHSNKPWGAALATKNKSLSLALLKNTIFSPSSPYPCTPLKFCPNPLLWDLHSARHNPYSLMSQNISVFQHHSLFAFNFPRNASAISRLSPYTPKANTQCMCVWETASTAPSEKKAAPVDFRMLSANEIFWSAARWWQMICINLALSLTLSKQRAASKAHRFEKWNDATWDFFVSYFLRCLLSSPCLIVWGKLDDIRRAESNSLQNNREGNEVRPSSC